MATDRLNDFIRSGEPHPTVALDADQVLAKTFDLIVEMINEKKGTKHTLEDMKTYPHPGTRFLGITTEEFNEMFDNLWASGWKRIGSIADPDLLFIFCKVFKADVVSSRGEEAAKPLRDWIKHNYPKVNLKVVAVPKYSDKTLLPYQIFIDDAPRLAESISKMNDKLLLLIDAPYNRKIKETSNIIRFKDVNAAFEALLSTRSNLSPKRMG
jgi:uncharacterized HAD superfamily protein